MKLKNRLTQHVYTPFFAIIIIGCIVDILSAIALTYSPLNLGQSLQMILLLFIITFICLKRYYRTDLLIFPTLSAGILALGVLVLFANIISLSPFILMIVLISVFNILLSLFLGITLKRFTKREQFPNAIAEMV